MTTELKFLILTLILGLVFWVKHRISFYRLKTFLIKKGNHRSKVSWWPFFKRKRSFIFVFNQSATYDIGENQDALNKLIGFSDGGLDHHKNSFRLAWKYNKDKDCIEIHSYIYVNGGRESEFLFNVLFDTPYTVAVECRNNLYRVLLNNMHFNQVFYLRRGLKTKNTYKHMLWPYFGGKAVAPHDISLLVTWI